MNQGKNKDKDNKTVLPSNKKDFNTGIHSPSSLLNVNAGYDDTGMGENEKSSGKKEDKKINKGKPKKKTGH